MDIQQAITNIKNDLENAIENGIVNGRRFDTKGRPFENGLKAKEALIRSSALINYIHEFTKHELIRHQIDETKIFPPLHCTKPEIKITGLLKQKDQDVCVKPTNIAPQREKITWGPLAYENVYCQYGKRLTEQCLVINIRSQLSSLAKNADTLFERTFAEASNLHTLHPKICLGEIYLIPVKEYDEAAMKDNRVAFKRATTKLEKYISFFDYINGRTCETDETHKYERCALLIVDFNHEVPKLYSTTDELKQDGLISDDFPIELRNISLHRFFDDLIDVYEKRFNNDDIFVR